jgi:hypothetical protein
MMTRTEALALIKQHGGVRPAARALGIWPNTLHRALARTGAPRAPAARKKAAVAQSPSTRSSPGETLAGPPDIE